MGEVMNEVGVQMLRNALWAAEEWVQSSGHHGSCAAMRCSLCPLPLGFHVRPDAPDIRADHEPTPGQCTCGRDDVLRQVREVLGE